MEITTKGRYAVRVMAELARKVDYLSISEIATSQKISQKYLEKIISPLAKAGLVESKRGTDGGYKLKRNPQEYNIKEILDAMGESTKVASCGGEEKCPMAEKCDTMGIWHTLNHLISDYLENITLKDLIEKTFNSKEGANGCN